MKKVLMLLVCIILLASFVVASVIAPSPTCKINAEINKVTYQEAYFIEYEDIIVCSNITIPAKYLLNVKITGVSTVINRGPEWSTCEKLYPINSEQTLTIYKSEIESAHTFAIGEFLSGKIHLSSIGVSSTGECESEILGKSQLCECEGGIYLSDYATSHIEEPAEEKEHELNSTEIQKIKQNQNRIKYSYANQTECPDNCTCAGSTIKCWINGQREMTIVAGRSGNVIVQVKGVNASTNVSLYKSEGKLYGVFNGETKRIMTPEQVQEKIRERKQKTWEEHNITLDEEGYYRVQSKKKARLFLLVPVREKVRTQIDAETGEIIKIRNPWWGFLANDIKEEELVGASCGTVSPTGRDECCQNKGYDVWDAEAVECIFNE